MPQTHSAFGPHLLSYPFLTSLTLYNRIFSFLKIISAGSTGTVTNYSPRFSLTGMTGSFPNNVAAAVTKISGTDGPKTENSAQANQAAGAGASAGPSGAYAVPYTMQTGSIKYAPMQKPPGTAITAKNPTPLYPTSSVQFASTYLPMPSQITTMTAPLTGSAQSRANTVWEMSLLVTYVFSPLGLALFADHRYPFFSSFCSRAVAFADFLILQAAPAVKPSDDMQRYLNRWKD